VARRTWWQPSPAELAQAKAEVCAAIAAGARPAGRSPIAAQNPKGVGFYPRPRRQPLGLARRDFFRPLFPAVGKRGGNAGHPVLSLKMP
jgi:hypothetical protein